MKNFIHRNTLLLAIIGLVIVSCANRSYPPGGPVDNTPPVLLEAQPPQGSLLFKGNTIQLHFNEYLQFNNIQTEFLCSPPLENRPEIKLSGKTVKVIFREELKPDLTYRLYFGNAIVDNNERNVFRNFSYVFSTGNALDSMLIEGRVYNAFSLKPELGAIVALYTKNEDSIVAKEKPYYVSRTDSSGFFSIPYLQNQAYKIFVLRDLNSNLKYDLATEEIAFAQKQVLPWLKHSFDSDSTAYKPESLFLFLPESEEIQRLVSSSFVQDNHLLIISKYPLVSPKIAILPPHQNLSFVSEFSSKADSLHIWIKDSNLIDTIFFTLSDAGSKLSDTTLKIVRDQSKKGKVSIMSSNFSSKHAYFKPLELTFTNPLQKADSLHAVQIIYENDTLYPAISIIDTIRRKARINYSLKEGAEYKIIIFGNRFTDIYGQTNDTLQFTAKVDTPEDYGDMFFSFGSKEEECQYIIQLLDERENILSEFIVNKENKLSFEHLNPGNYRIKIIEDKNNNGKWDSGDYWLKKAPETVRFFPKPITIRANWILEENFQWETVE